MTLTKLDGAIHHALLAPSEQVGWWISGDKEGVGDKIEVVEVFMSKDAAMRASGDIGTANAQAEGS